MESLEEKRDKIIDEICYGANLLDECEPYDGRCCKASYAKAVWDACQKEMEGEVQKNKLDSERWQRMLNQAQDLAISRAKEIKRLEAKVEKLQSLLLSFQS